MATIGSEKFTRKNGSTTTTYRILWCDEDGRRKTLRLGAVPKRVAQEYKTHLETIIAAQRGGWAVDADTAAWIGSRPNDVHERLVTAGLFEPRAESQAKAIVTLGELCETFKGRKTVKPSTAAAYDQTLDSLKAVLGADRDIATLTTADADEWKKAISTATKGEGKRKKKRTTEDGRLSHATVAKRVCVGKQVFGKAVSWGLLEKNPFSGLKAGSQVNAARQRYIDVPTIERVLAVAPGPQWRALIGLCRYAGLRCPSEVGLLTWDDVDRDTGKLTVRSPKTEGHGAGHAVRFVPIMPRLMSLLADAFDAAPPGSTLVVPMASDGGVNLRTGFERIITRAKCETWPRLFQALRASVETDWVQRYPAHVVAKWLGHSPRIAQAHYLITTEADFRAAIEYDLPGTESGTVSAGRRVSAVDKSTRRGFVTLGKLANRDVLNKCLLGGEGLEPPTPSV